MKKPVQTLRLETRSNLDSLDHFIVVDAKPKLSFKYMLDGVTVVEKSAYDSLATDHERLLAERDATIAELTARLRGGMQLCSFRLSNWDKSEVKLAQAGETIADLKARLKLNQSISKENFDLAAEKDITITNQARLLDEKSDVIGTLGLRIFERDKTIAELTRERDLAIAHDRQPYPTAYAYEKACAELEAQRRTIAKLKTIERDYSNHFEDCTGADTDDDAQPCDCGLDKLLTEIYAIETSGDKADE